jgi:hypothetical protein
MRLLMIIGLLYLCCVPEIFAAPYQKKTNINEQDSLGRTAILEAASFGQAAKVTELIKKGADVNIPDNEGRTPLMWGVLSGNVETVKVLVGAGADPLAKDKKGNTALSYAQLALRATSSLSQGKDRYSYSRQQSIGPAPDQKEYSSSQQILQIVEERTNQVSLELKAKEDSLKPPVKKEEPVNPPKPPPIGKVTSEDFNSSLTPPAYEAVIVNEVKNINGLKRVEVGSLQLDVIVLRFRTNSASNLNEELTAGTLSVARQSLSPADQLKMEVFDEIVIIKYSSTKDLVFGMSLENFKELINKFDEVLRANQYFYGRYVEFAQLPRDPNNRNPARFSVTYENKNIHDGNRYKEKRVYNFSIEHSPGPEIFMTLNASTILELLKLFRAALPSAENGSK